MVNQFMNNAYESKFYDIDKKESIANYKQIYYLPELKEKLKYCYTNIKSKDPKIIEKINADLRMLRTEFKKQHNVLPQFSIDKFVSKIQKDSLTLFISFLANAYITTLDDYYGKMFLKANTKKEKIINWAIETNPKLYKKLKNDYKNDAINDLVKNIYEKRQIIRYKDELVQQIDPIFLDPMSDRGYLNFRSHFYAPHKFFAGHYYKTFSFNIIIIWIMTLLLYITLYYNALGRLLVVRRKKDWKKYFSLKQILSTFKK